MARGFRVSNSLIQYRREGVLLQLNLHVLFVLLTCFGLLQPAATTAQDQDTDRPEYVPTDSDLSFFDRRSRHLRLELDELAESTPCAQSRTDFPSRTVTLSERVFSCQRDLKFLAKKMQKAIDFQKRHCPERPESNEARVFEKMSSIKRFCYLYITEIYLPEATVRYLDTDRVYEEISTRQQRCKFRQRSIECNPR